MNGSALQQEAPAARSGPVALEDFWLHSGSGRPPLRVGVMVDDFVQPAWVERILDQIQRCDFATLDLVVVRRDGESPARPGPARRFPERLAGLLADPGRRSRLLYGLYARLDRRLFARRDDPLRPVDCASRLSDLERLPVSPLIDGRAQRFPAEAVEAIRSRDLDVLLRFGFGILTGDILHAARCGIWSYHHGDNDTYRGGPAHFWEVIERHPQSGVLLQVLDEELDGGLVLCKSLVPTRQGISATLNRQLPYWTGASFVIRSLHDLHRHGWEHLQRRAVPNRPVPGRRRLYRPPTNGEMVRRVLPRALGKLLGRPLRRERPQRWRIALREAPRRAALPDRPFPMDGFRFIETPPGHEHADPFLFRLGERTWLFFEDHDVALGRAAIACAEVTEGGRAAEPRVVLRRPYHLSFPFVFEEAGEVYMIPESGGNRTVELYRATRFPDAWEQEAVLLSGTRALDTVMWREAGRFWFFVTLCDPPQAAPQLYLFHAGAPAGRWTYHPANPIGSDARYARAAGAVFPVGPRRIRPVQDGGRDYGHAIHFREITRLTPTEYEERPLWTLLPEWEEGLRGTHTYARCGTIEAVDGRGLVPRRRRAGTGGARVP